MGRYEIVRKNEELRFQKECPLLIVSSAITKDIQKEALLAQIKFLNICSKRIVAVYIQLQGKSIDGTRFECSEEFVYLDLSVDGFVEFGANTPVYLSNIQTRDLIITCQKIIYDDSCIWEGDPETNFVKLSLENPVQNLINKEAYGELCQELMEQKVCFSEICKPSSEGNIHLCGCGKYYFGSENCPYCGKDFGWWNVQIDENELLRKKSIRGEALRRKSEEEKQRAELLEKERLQKKEEDKKRQKKIFKRAGAVCCISMVVIIGYVIATNIVIPGGNYNKACDYAQSGDYESAIEWIEKAGKYKDSIAKKEEFEKMQQYEEAVTLMNDGQYENAIQIWSLLGDFEDSREQCNEACEKKNQADYKDACDKIANQEFDVAETILTKLGNYQDSVELLKEVHYQQALIKVQEGEYSDAVSLFAELNDYKDSATQYQDSIEQLKEVHYQQALIKMQEGEYSDAVSLFAELNDYKDSAAQSLNAQHKTLENPQCGDIVYCGTYEQDGDINNGKEPIAWRVLSTQENGFAAVSVYCLDYRKYLEDNVYLNNWLAREFTSEAFTIEEKEHVEVRLLTLRTLKSDFSSDEDRMASPTQYAKDKSGRNSSEDTCEYWYDHKSISNLESAAEAPLISKIGCYSTTLGQYQLSSNYVRPELIYYGQP